MQGQKETPEQLHLVIKMTSTPVSLNDESLNGSWIDINSASQINSPIDNDSPEHQRPPYSFAESAQSLGLLSFQVERFLQEAQKSHFHNSNNQDGQQQQQQPYPFVDNISDICFSDSDMSEEGLQNTKQLLDRLRENNDKSKQRQQQHHSGDNPNDSLNLMSSPDTHRTPSQRLSKSGECLADQLSDSLSLLSRASLFGETGFMGVGSTTTLDRENNFQDFDWLWDWTAQPEYFTGQEWKVSPPKQDYLMKQKQIYCANNHHNEKLFSGEIMSLLFLTNILSIIIGAGITYSILMRRSSV